MGSRFSKNFIVTRIAGAIKKQGINVGLLKLGGDLVIYCRPFIILGVLKNGTLISILFSLCRITPLIEENVSYRVFRGVI